MPRMRRLHYYVENGIYHIMSRIALDKYFDEEDKDVLLRMIKHFSKIYYCRMFAYSIMGNHFHLIVQMCEDVKNSETDFQKRYKLYSNVLSFTPVYSIHNNDDIIKLKSKWSKLSEFVKDIKLSFTRYYNNKYNRKGYLWGGRFKSVLLEKGEALINCMAYIDLNPVRAALTRKPEDYRWNSMYYHVVIRNKDKWLSLDYSNHYSDNTNLNNKKKLNVEKIMLYRKYLYKTDVETDCKDKEDNISIDAKLDEKKIKSVKINNFNYSFKDKFMQRCRYFSDSLIIGSHDFVKDMHAVYKNKANEKRVRRFSKIKNYESIYSMRDLRKNILIA